jgi:hypothetical protein
LIVDWLLICDWRMLIESTNPAREPPLRVSQLLGLAGLVG